MRLELNVLQSCEAFFWYKSPEKFPVRYIKLDIHSPFFCLAFRRDKLETSVSKASDGVELRCNRAAHARTARNYKPKGSLNDCIKGMLEEQKQLLVLCLSWLRWESLGVVAATGLPSDFPAGNAAAALSHVTSCSWWQLVGAAHVLFSEDFGLGSTFCCWNSNFLALCLSTASWSSATRWLVE